MAGGWINGLTLNNAQDVGSGLSFTGWTDVIAGGTAFTKGSWTQLIASTSGDVSWVMVQCANVRASVALSFAFDLAVGASGSEVAIASNLLISADQSVQATYFFPLCIKAGTRISARSASDHASDTGAIKLTVFDDTAMSCGVGSGIDTYGFTSASNLGVTIDPGATANTASSYVQISSSLTNDIAGFFLGFDDQNATTGTVGPLREIMDIAIGASGSEKVILPSFLLFRTISGGGTLHMPEASHYFPIPIKAGTRIAARAQSNTTVSPDRKFGLTFYGVRQ